MTDDAFERYFDGGGDTTAYMVADSVRQPNKSGQRMVDLGIDATCRPALVTRSS